jgi:D-sedoheptulose 7-phosphate isomerase
MRDRIVQSIKESIRTKETLLTNGLVDKIEEGAALLIETYQKKGKLLLCGNGGSAADAQHIAAELVGRFEKERRALPAIALTTNSSNLTCIANDYDFETVFSRQVEAQAQKGDLLLAISTSGNSKNVLKAVEAAKKLGVRVIGLTGRSGGKLKGKVDLLLNVPSDETPRIQESHILIGHILCDLLERQLFGS